MHPGSCRLAGGTWSGCPGRGTGADHQLVACDHLAGVLDAIELDQALDRDVVAIRDFGEGVSRLHGHGGATASVTARAPASVTGGGGGPQNQGIACDNPGGIADAVELHEALHRHPIPFGDLREGLALTDGDPAALGRCGRAIASVAAPSSLGSPWNGESLARHDLVGIPDAIELHQTFGGDAGPGGDFRERLSWLDHHLSGQAR